MKRIGIREANYLDTDLVSDGAAVKVFLINTMLLTTMLNNTPKLMIFKQLLNNRNFNEENHIQYKSVFTCSIFRYFHPHKKWRRLRVKMPLLSQIRTECENPRQSSDRETHQKWGIFCTFF
jgi:hypothetical protein